MRLFAPWLGAGRPIPLGLPIVVNWAHPMNVGLYRSCFWDGVWWRELISRRYATAMTVTGTPRSASPIGPACAFSGAWQANWTADDKTLGNNPISFSIYGNFPNGQTTFRCAMCEGISASPYTRFDVEENVTNGTATQNYIAACLYGDNINRIYWGPDTAVLDGTFKHHIGAVSSFSDFAWWIDGVPQSCTSATAGSWSSINITTAYSWSIAARQTGSRSYSTIPFGETWKRRFTDAEAKELTSHPFGTAANPRFFVMIPGWTRWLLESAYPDLWAWRTIAADYARQF